MTDNPFEPALRRIVTGSDAGGRSRVIIDGPPAEVNAIAGLFEIWSDTLAGPIVRTNTGDRAAGKPQLVPPPGEVKIRWFQVRPRPEGLDEAAYRDLVKAAFADIGAAGHQPDTSRHPAMHETPSLDAIILVSGAVTLILDEGEVSLKPGDVVVQRATNHAWQVEGDTPATLVAVLIDRR